MLRKKQRLDVRLVENGLYPSREKARTAIMAGLVFVDSELVDKPGTFVNACSSIEVRDCSLPYVSRGGFKLEKAIKVFGLDLKDRVIVDVGASTGGFTDCALKHGARLVYSVDVGYGQLDWQLRNNPRVVVLERTNIRHLTSTALYEKPDFATVDVSFISLKIVLPKIGELTTAGAQGVALIKPQFEAGRQNVGKKGVVRDINVQTDVVKNIIGLIKSMGWFVGGLDYSPIKGPQGNIEFLVYFKKTGEDAKYNIEAVVRRAHTELDQNNK